MSMLLAKAFERWRRAEPRRPATVRRYRNALGRLARLGIVRVADATRDRVERAQSDLLERGWSESSVRSEMICLRSILRFLDDREELADGQLAAVRKVALKRKTARRRRTRFLTHDEFEALAQGAARLLPRLELPLRVAVLAGPRVGELARIRAEDVRDGALSIVTRPEWGELGSCKTGERVIPVCRELQELVDKRLPKTGWWFPAMKCYRRDQLTRPFVSRSTLERALRKLRRALGVEEITWTILRHTRASWWVQGGASIYKVADWCGHNVATAELYYASLTDGYDPECEKSSELERARPIVAPTVAKPRPFLYGPPPIGYQHGPNGVGVEVNVEGALTVRLVFSLYLKCGSVMKVVRDLMARKIPSPTGRARWHHETVRAILRNRAYLGLVVLDGEDRPGVHQAIVDRAIFDRVQKGLAENDTRRSVAADAKPARRVAT
ncbi:MAG TPA: recombinase family protein [Planctomycetota bacterium]|nr:recombinase family protein [Planctomycetota bacterium]